MKRRIEGIMTNRFARSLARPGTDGSVHAALKATPWDRFVCPWGKRFMLSVAAMVPLAAPIVMGLLNPPRSRAQAESAPLPSFEVASVKVTASADIPRSRSGVPFSRGMRGGPGTNSPERLTASYVPLSDLILRAYGLENYQLFGPASLKG